VRSLVEQKLAVMSPDDSRSTRMKSWIEKTALAFAVTVALPVFARADTWQIDPAHTNVEFTVRHMMISNVKG
jgi:polyisoprenoid-binding protein YceI